MKGQTFFLLSSLESSIEVPSKDTESQIFIWFTRGRVKRDSHECEIGLEGHLNRCQGQKNAAATAQRRMNFSRFQIPLNN